ncbi:MAG: AraC family transcriptional regulator [Pseudomonadota bacterium]
MVGDAIGTEDYLSFYQRAYGDFIVERRLVHGEKGIGMFICQQPEGYFPDDPLSTYNLQLNIGSGVVAGVDLGVGSHEVSLKRGEFVIAPPDTSTEYTVYSKHRLMCLGMPQSVFDQAAADLGIDMSAFEALLTGGHADPVVRQVVKECWAETNHNTARGALFVDSSLMTLAHRILKLSLNRDFVQDEIKEPALSDRLYERICQYVDSNIDVGMRMRSLARLVDMSEYAFSRAFKARTGRSPYQWVIDRRLNRAEVLLQQSKMSIAEIAYAAGFSSQSHMTTLFSQRAGITPAEFRKAR